MNTETTSVLELQLVEKIKKCAQEILSQSEESIAFNRVDDDTVKVLKRLFRDLDKLVGALEASNVIRTHILGDGTTRDGYRGP